MSTAYVTRTASAVFADTGQAVQALEFNGSDRRRAAARCSAAELLAILFDVNTVRHTRVAHNWSSDQYSGLNGYRALSRETHRLDVVGTPDAVARYLSALPRLLSHLEARATAGARRLGAWLRTAAGENATEDRTPDGMRWLRADFRRDVYTRCVWNIADGRVERPEWDDRPLFRQADAVGDAVTVESPVDVQSLVDEEEAAAIAAAFHVVPLDETADSDDTRAVLAEAGDVVDAAALEELAAVVVPDTVDEVLAAAGDTAPVDVVDAAALEEAGVQGAFDFAALVGAGAPVPAEADVARELPHHPESCSVLHVSNYTGGNITMNEQLPKMTKAQAEAFNTARRTAGGHLRIGQGFSRVTAAKLVDLNLARWTNREPKGWAIEVYSGLLIADAPTATPAPAEEPAAEQAPAPIARNAFEQAAAGLLDEPTAGRYTLRVCEAPRDVCERGACSTSSTRAAGTLDEVRTAAASFRHAWAVDAAGRIIGLNDETPAPAAVLTDPVTVFAEAIADTDAAEEPAPLTLAQAVVAVDANYPHATAFEPHRDADGAFIGYTFQTDTTARARFSWITPSGTYGRGTEPYRSEAAALLPVAVLDDQRSAERRTTNADRAAAAADRKRAADAVRAAQRAEMDDRVAAEHAGHGVPAPAAVRERIAARQAAATEQPTPGPVLQWDVLDRDGEWLATVAATSEEEARAAVEHHTLVRRARVMRGGDVRVVLLSSDPLAMTRRDAADRARVTWRDVRDVRPAYLDDDGVSLIGYTFRSGSGYGWVTQAGRVAEVPQFYRTDATRQVRTAHDQDCEEQRPGRFIPPAIRPAVAAEERAQELTRATYPGATTFRPVALVSGRTAGWTFRTGHGAGARYGWVTAAGNLCRDLVEYVSKAERICRGEHTVTAPGRRLVDVAVVARAATASGCTPANVHNDQVQNAIDLLDGLTAASMTDDHDVSEPTGDEEHVRGYLVDPRGGSRVAVYWLEGGRIVRRDSDHGAALDRLAHRFTERGWTVEKLLRSSQCVFAHPPLNPPHRPVTCDAHAGGAHAESPDCLYPHEVTANGDWPTVGHPYRVTD